MASLLLFLSVAAVYVLLLSVSRLEKKRQKHQKSDRPIVQQRQQHQEKLANPADTHPAKSPLKVEHQLESALDAFNQQEKWVVQQQKRDAKQSSKSPATNSPKPDRTILKEQPKQPVQPQRQQVQEKTCEKKAMNFDRQFEIQENQRRQQQEIEADRLRILKEKQTADRKLQQEIEADRIRLYQAKQAEDQKRHQEMEDDRLRLRQQQQNTAKSTAKNTKTHPTDKPQGKVSPTLKSKLERLCGSDYRLAQRLVDGIREDHPDRTEQWCWEKAIWDIERDRCR